MSSIIYSTIDEAYPVAGQDNNSQGFRDNFNIIKTGLGQAKTEITALEENTAKVNTDNDFNGNVLENAEYKNIHGTVYPIGSTGVGTNIYVANGPYQVIVATADILLTFRDWPDNNLYSKIVLDLRGDTAAIRTITFSSEGGATLRYSSNYPSPFQLSTAGERHLVEVWTYDGGGAVYINYLGEFA